MSHPSSIANASVEPVRHLDELEDLLIDAEADDEQVPHTPPVVLRPWLLLLGLVLVALNLRPALSSMAPLLGEVSDKLGLSAAQAGLLTTCRYCAWACSHHWRQSWRGVLAQSGWCWVFC